MSKTHCNFMQGLYMLNKKHKVGVNVYPNSKLPIKLSFDYIARIIAKMQMKCFKDDNKDNENYNRLLSVLESTENKTIMVSLCLGCFIENDILAFTDGAVATLQDATYIPNTRKSRQLVINEVCRSNLGDHQKKPSPVNFVMRNLHNYCFTQLIPQDTRKKYKYKGVFLLIEKNPPENLVFLNRYYNSKYGYMMYDMQSEPSTAYMILTHDKYIQTIQNNNL